MALHGKFIQDNTVTPAKIDLSAASAPGHPASRQFVGDSIQQAAFNMDTKDSVVCATTANITPTGLLTIDGVTLVAGNRVLVKNQTTQTQNGIYVVGTGAWVRSTDFDSSTEVTSQSNTSVEQGTVNINTTWRLTGAGPFTVGTSNLVFQLFSTFAQALPTISNKNMACSLTATDGDVACNTGIISTPSNGSYVTVYVGADDTKMKLDYGNGTKTGVSAYFSGDSGTTARAHNAIQAADKLYWNGSVAGCQLATTDRCTYEYQV